MRPLFVFLSLLMTLSAQSKPMTPIQAVSLRMVTAPIVSGDGSLIAFRRIIPRLADVSPGASQSELCVYRVGEPFEQIRVFLPKTESFGGPAFSPDGKYLTVTQKRLDDAHREVWGYPLSGGAPVRITRTEHGVSSYVWSPDGTRIAYTRTAPLSDARKKARGAGFKTEVYEEDARNIHLMLYDIASGESSELVTSGAVLDVKWDKRGHQVYFAMAPRNLVDDSYMNRHMFAVDLETKEVSSLADTPGKLGAWAMNDDGTRLAFIGAADRRDPHAGMLFLKNMGTHETVCIGTEKFRGKFESVYWEDEVLHGVVSLGVKSWTYSVEGTALRMGEELPLQTHGFEQVPGQATRVFVGSTAQHPDELFLQREGRFERVTNCNPWLEDVALGEQTVEKVKARDGLEIEGILMKPVGYESGKRYPLLIVAHGGPESHFGNGWLTYYSYWGQILAGRGYCVWFPNYRASTGYGVEFAKADHGDPMGGEFEDHLDAIDHFVNKGLVDRDRVAIGGGSYGGYTAAWAATRHSEHFAAAVSFVPFVDIRTKWYTSDIPQEFFHVHYEEKLPEDQADFLKERSPLTYAAYCKTPLLILGGDKDPRVHPSQPHMLYRAVKMTTDTPVRYVRYPGERHGNRVNTYRYDYLIRTLRWIEHYTGAEAKRTDPPPSWELDLSDWYDTKK